MCELRDNEWCFTILKITSNYALQSRFTKAPFLVHVNRFHQESPPPRPGTQLLPPQRHLYSNIPPNQNSTQIRTACYHRFFLAMTKKTIGFVGYERLYWFLASFPVRLYCKLTYTKMCNHTHPCHPMFLGKYWGERGGYESSRTLLGGIRSRIYLAGTCARMDGSVLET